MPKSWCHFQCLSFDHENGVRLHRCGESDQDNMKEMQRLNRAVLLLAVAAIVQGDQQPKAAEHLCLTTFSQSNYTIADVITRHEGNRPDCLPKNCHYTKCSSDVQVTEPTACAVYIEHTDNTKQPLRFGCMQLNQLKNQQAKKITDDKDMASPICDTQLHPTTSHKMTYCVCNTNKCNVGNQLQAFIDQVNKDMPPPPTTPTTRTTQEHDPNSPPANTTANDTDTSTVKAKTTTEQAKATSSTSTKLTRTTTKEKKGMPMWVLVTTIAVIVLLLLLIIAVLITTIAVIVLVLLLIIAVQVTTIAVIELLLPLNIAVQVLCWFCRYLHSAFTIRVSSDWRPRVSVSLLL